MLPFSSLLFIFSFGPYSTENVVTQKFVKLLRMVNLSFRSCKYKIVPSENTLEDAEVIIGNLVQVSIPKEIL